MSGLRDGPLAGDGSGFKKASRLSKGSGLSLSISGTSVCLSGCGIDSCRVSSELLIVDTALVVRLSQAKPEALVE
jgi:hypothetical protein